MLALDSLVLDLIFEADAAIDPEGLVAALGGEEVASARLLVDPDQQPPEFEMQVSPSVPLRRDGERRLMIIDDSVAPMRPDPHAEPVVPVDLRAEKARLIAACEALPVRIGRMFALGSWGDAVIAAKAARDLRAVALLPWALDPSIDTDGKRRASPLSEEEIKEKLFAFEKRLDELPENEILSDLGPAALERRGDLLVVSVLEADGTWDTRNSRLLEDALAATERFALFPGAPATGAGDRDPAGAGAGRRAEPRAEPAARAPDGPEPDGPEQDAGPPLAVHEVQGRLVVAFPRERFGLDVMASLGTGAWNDVWGPGDPVDRGTRDRVESEGAGFVAPLEFLSEVFFDGKPLSRPTFEAEAQPISGGAARALRVHCPRFGTALLLDIERAGRFVTSETERPEAVLDLVA